MTKGGRVEDETKLQITKYKLQCSKLQTKKQWEAWSLVSKVGMLSELRRLKGSIPGVQATFHQSHDIQKFDAFAVDSVHLKKPSGGPGGFIGPPCHGVPWLAETKINCISFVNMLYFPKVNHHGNEKTANREV
jgi:hypothetical protein